jgi:hypothetical protein
MLKFLVDQDYVQQQDDEKDEKNFFHHILDKFFHVGNQLMKE